MNTIKITINNVVTMMVTITMNNMEMETFMMIMRTMDITPTRITTIAGTTRARKKAAIDRGNHTTQQLFWNQI